MNNGKSVGRCDW